MLVPFSSATFKERIEFRDRLTANKKRPDGCPVDLYRPENEELGNEMSGCNHECDVRDFV